MALTPALGDGESCPGGGWCLRRACTGSSSLRPGRTSLGGRGVLHMRWSVLKEGLRGVAVPNGSGTPASGDGESCPGGDRCSRSACGGQLLPTAPLGGWGVLPRRWSVLKEGLRGVAAPNGLGTSSGGRGVLPRRWSVLKEGLWGAVAPNSPLGGTGSPAQAVVDGQGGPTGGSSSRWPWHQLRGMGSPPKAVVGAQGGPAGSSSS